MMMFVFTPERHLPTSGQRQPLAVHRFLRLDNYVFRELAALYHLCEQHSLSIGAAQHSAARIKIQNERCGQAGAALG